MKSIRDLLVTSFANAIRRFDYVIFVYILEQVCCLVKSVYSNHHFELRYFIIITIILFFCDSHESLLALWFLSNSLYDEF